MLFLIQIKTASKHTYYMFISPTGSKQQTVQHYSSFWDFTSWPAEGGELHLQVREYCTIQEDHFRQFANICKGQNCLKADNTNKWSHNNKKLVLCSHLFAGMDRFPVVFKLSYGREILVRQTSIYSDTRLIFNQV